MDKNKILEDYIGNDMKKIKKICKKIISKTNVPEMDILKNITTKQLMF